MLSYRWVRLAAICLALLATLIACSGPPPVTLNPDDAVAITRVDGSVTLARPSTGSQGDLPENAQLVAGDHLYTASSQTATLRFPDGSTLQMGPDSQLQFLTVRPADRVLVFRLLAGSATSDVRGNAFEVQAHEEVAMNFNMVATDLTVVPRGAAGRYQLRLKDDVLQAFIEAGEFDVRSGNQQATLPAGWQASAAPGQSMQLVPVTTPTPAPSSTAEAPTATSIQIISITPTSQPSDTPTDTDTATATAVPTRTPTRVQIIITSTPTPIIMVDTPVPTAAEKPKKPPQPTNPPPQPTNPPPQPTPKPPPPPQPTKPPRPTLPGPTNG